MKISPWGKEYIPACLAVFATNVKDKNASTQINKNGALLDLEIHQISGDDETPLQDDGTKLIFETNESCIKISTNRGGENSNYLELPLSSFLKNRQSVNLVTSKRIYYNNLESIRISCNGATTKGALITVKAKKNAVVEIVGQLYIFPNDKVPLAKI